MTDRTAAAELGGSRSWGPSALLDLLDGHLQRLPSDFDARANACVLAFSAVQSNKVVPVTDERSTGPSG